MGITGILVMLAVYFLPTIIAASKKKLSTNAIFTVNLIPLVGWIIALVWALKVDRVDQVDVRFSFKHYCLPAIILGIMLLGIIVSFITNQITPTANTNGTGQTTGSSVIGSTLAPQIPQKEYIEINKPITVPDNCRIMVDQVDFRDDLIPSHPDMFYSHYEVKNKENTYLHLSMMVKNLQTKSARASEFAEVTAKYDSKYDYNAFSTIEKDGGTDFTYTSITGIDPLMTGRLHFLIEIPKEAKNDNLPLEIKVKISDKDYYYKVK